MKRPPWDTNNASECYLHVKKFPKELLMKLNMAKAKTGRSIRDIVGEAVQDWMKKK